MHMADLFTHLKYKGFEPENFKLKKYSKWCVVNSLYDLRVTFLYLTRNLSEKKVSNDDIIRYLCYYFKNDRGGGGDTYV